MRPLTRAPVLQGYSSSVTWLQPVQSFDPAADEDLEEPRLEIQLRAPYPAFDKNEVLALAERM